MNDPEPPQCKNLFSGDHIWPEPERAALGVRRWHTWPVLQQQTTADHSLHVLRLYCKLFGWPPPHVTYYIIHHDTGEYITGDIPFHAKQIGGLGFKDQIRDVEHAGMSEQLPRVWQEWCRAEHQLSQADRWRVKACDLLEMVEFSLMEVRLGNRMFDVVIDRVGQAIGKHCGADLVSRHGPPPEDVQTVLFYCNELAEATR